MNGKYASNTLKPPFHVVITHVAGYSAVVPSDPANVQRGRGYRAPTMWRAAQ